VPCTFCGAPAEADCGHVDTDPAHPLLTPFAGRRLASRRGGVIA
jgi:hypothetical protein